MILVYNLYTILHDLVDTIQTQPVATQYHPKWLFLSTDCTSFISIICVDFIYQGFKVWRISIVISIYSVYDIYIYTACIPVHFYVYTIFIHQSSKILEILKQHVSFLEDATISIEGNHPSDLTYILQQKLVSNGTSSHLCWNGKEKHPNQRSNSLGSVSVFFGGEVYNSTWCFKIILLHQISWPRNQQNITRVFLSLE